MNKTVSMIAVLTLALSMSAYAADSISSSSSSGKMDKFSSSAIKASDLIGTNIQNSQGQNLGKINDLAIDTQSGKIAFALVSQSGSAGMANKYVAVPIDALSLSGSKATLDVSKDKLSKAPTFDKNNMSAMSDRSRINESYRYFGVQPYWESSSGMESPSSSGSGGSSSSDMNMDSSGMGGSSSSDMGTGGTGTTMDDSGTGGSSSSDMSTGGTGTVMDDYGTGGSSPNDMSTGGTGTTMDDYGTGGSSPNDMSTGGTGTTMDDSGTGGSSGSDTSNSGMEGSKY